MHGPNASTITERVPAADLPLVEEASAALNALIRSGASQNDISFATADVSNAFRRIPMRVADWIHFTRRIQDDAGRAVELLDTSLPMGATSSMSWLCQCTRIIAQVLNDGDREVTAIAYADDFLYIGSSAEAVQSRIDKDAKLMEDIGVPFSPTKITSPAPEVTWIGHRIGRNSDGQFSIEMDDDKRTKILAKIRRLEKGRHLTLDDARKLTGRMAFVGSVLPALRGIATRITRSLYRSIAQRAPQIRLPMSARPLARWMASFMHKADCIRAPLRHLDKEEPPDIRVFLDSSEFGVGGFLVDDRQPAPRIKAWHGEWPTRMPDSNRHEYKHIALALQKWSDEWAGAKVLIHGDNIGSLARAQKGGGHFRLEDSIDDAFTIALACMHSQVTVVTKHIPGESLTMPDAISRCPPGTSPQAWLAADSALWTRCVDSAVALSNSRPEQISQALESILTLHIPSSATQRTQWRESSPVPKDLALSGPPAKHSQTTSNTTEKHHGSSMGIPEISQSRDSMTGWSTPEGTPRVRRQHTRMELSGSTQHSESGPTPRTRTNSSPSPRKERSELGRRGRTSETRSRGHSSKTSSAIPASTLDCEQPSWSPGTRLSGSENSLISMVKGKTSRSASTTSSCTLTDTESEYSENLESGKRCSMSMETVRETQLQSTPNQSSTNWPDGKPQESSTRPSSFRSLRGGPTSPTIRSQQWFGKQGSPSQPHSDWQDIQSESEWPRKHTSAECPSTTSNDSGPGPPKHSSYTFVPLLQSGPPPLQHAR